MNDNLCEHKQFLRTMQLKRDKKTIDKLFYCCLECEKIIEINVHDLTDEFIELEKKVVNNHKFSYVPESDQPLSEEYKEILYDLFRGQARVTRRWIEITIDEKKCETNS